MFRSSEELKKIFGDCKAKYDDLHGVAGIAFQEAALEILSAAREDSKVLREFLHTTGGVLIPTVRAIQNEQAKANEAHKKKKLDE